MKKNNKKQIIYKYIAIWLISLSLGCFFRLYPLLTFTSNDSSEKATVYVLAQLKTKIVNNVEQKYPHIKGKKKEVLIKKSFDNLLHKDRKKIRQTIKDVSENIQKTSKKKKSTPYLLASDSFYYHNLTENIITKGKISDTVKGSKYLNKLMLAPNGHWEPFNLHPYVGYLIFQIQKLFNPNIDLMYALSFTPLLITILSLIPFLLISHYMRCKPWISFIGAVFFVLSPIFVKRSSFGWYDNDPYNILFPLTILACLFYGFQLLRKNSHPKDSLASEKKSATKMNIKKVHLAALFTSLAVMLYSLFWQGWVLMFAILFSSAIICNAYTFFFIKRGKPSYRPLLFYFTIICAGSFLAVSIIFGASEFFTLFAEGWRALKNFMIPQLAPWPDVYISVSELHRASLNYIIKHTGGLFFFSVALFGLIAQFKKALKDPKNNFLYELITIAIFLIVSLFITLGAQRFVMLSLIPLSLLFLWGLQYLFHLIKIPLDKYLKIKNSFIKKFADKLLILIFLTTIIIPIANINKSIESLLNPIYNDIWNEVLIKIKEETPENSIINTWWPPGHFIKSTAQRAVTFDGATINFPQAYWMANVFLSTTEEEAVGLLRMLNNSGNNATNYLHKTLGIPLSTSVDILKTISKAAPSTAKKLLNKGLGENKADYILAMTHKKPPPSYCLLYKEFVENNLQLGFFGKWNFKIVEEINANPQLLKKIPKRNSKEYVDFLWTLVGGAFKYSGPLSMISKKKDTLFFADNVKIDTNTMTCQVLSQKYGKGIPMSLFYLKDDAVIEKKLDNANLPFSVILYKTGKSFNTILLDRKLAQSLFIRLFFFEGKGLKYFHPFTKTSDLTGRTQIYVYSVDWETFQSANKN